MGSMQEGVLGLVAVDNLVRLGHITPQERASMADAVASAYNSGQISPYQLKWLISSYRHALGALTPGVRYPSLARRMSRCSITYLKRDGTPRI